MSDDRFDEDLRSVLDEDAPRRVPEDLRRRVAAIPLATPSITAGPSRPAWRQPFPIGFVAIGALVIVLAVGFWRFVPGGSSGAGNPGTASPSVAPSAVAVASRSPGGACLAADLTARILDWQGAAGSRIADVQVANSSTSACLLGGPSRLELLDAGGRVLVDSSGSGSKGQGQVSPTDAPLELAPGSHITTEVAASNYCGTAPTLPLEIAFTLPSGGGRFIASPSSGVSSADAAPPCLGTTGSSIAMNGWRK